VPPLLLAPLLLLLLLLLLPLTGPSQQLRRAAPSPLELHYR
jgi:hypothetical protein